MNASSSAGGPLQGRVIALIERYTGDALAVAALLCDEHEPTDVAYRIVDASLTRRSVTYAELRARSTRLASALAAQGLMPGDRVATLMGKSEEYLVVILAIWRLGAVHVPLFTAFAPPAIQMRLESSKAKLVFADPGYVEKLVQIRASQPELAYQITSTRPQEGADATYRSLMETGDDHFDSFVASGDTTFIEIYTSGTTGRPKGVPVPVRALAAFQAYAEFGLDLRKDDVFWNAGDPGWGYGLYFGILAVFTTGGEGVLFEGKFSPENYFGILAQQGVTNFTAAPTLYRSLRAYTGTVPKLALRVAAAAGEPLTPEVNLWAPSVLGCEVRDHFGQTEAGMLINNHNHPELRMPLRVGSMGQAMPGWSAAIIDAVTFQEVPRGKTGLLAFRVDNSPLAYFTGYIGDAAKTAERYSPDGKWYLSGDLASEDEDGYFYFSSRDDDVILMAGYRIGPFEVESVLSTHPLVAESAVIAVPDELRGEVLEAVVVLTAGAQPSDALTEELKSKVKNEYAAHAYPRKIHYRQSLPKTPSGKLQRFVIRKELKDSKEGGPDGA